MGEAQPAGLGSPRCRSWLAAGMSGGRSRSTGILWSVKRRKWGRVSEVQVRPFRALKKVKARGRTPLPAELLLRAALAWCHLRMAVAIFRRGPKRCKPMLFRSSSVMVTSVSKSTSYRKKIRKRKEGLSEGLLSRVAINTPAKLATATLYTHLLLKHAVVLLKAEALRRGVEGRVLAMSTSFGRPTRNSTRVNRNSTIHLQRESPRARHGCVDWRTLDEGCSTLHDCYHCWVGRRWGVAQFARGCAARRSMEGGTAVRRQRELMASHSQQY